MTLHMSLLLAHVCAWCLARHHTSHPWFDRVHHGGPDFCGPAAAQQADLPPINVLPLLLQLMMSTIGNKLMQKGHSNVSNQLVCHVSHCFPQGGHWWPQPQYVKYTIRCCIVFHIQHVDHSHVWSLGVYKACTLVGIHVVTVVHVPQGAAEPHQSDHDGVLSVEAHKEGHALGGRGGGQERRTSLLITTECHYMCE